jgi:hypothetical protein
VIVEIAPNSWQGLKHRDIDARQLSVISDAGLHQ